MVNLRMKLCMNSSLFVIQNSCIFDTWSARGACIKTGAVQTTTKTATTATTTNTFAEGPKPGSRAPGEEHPRPGAAPLPRSGAAGSAPGP
eukprot:1689898-Pyramimonas_sp.AAC.1